MKRILLYTDTPNIGGAEKHMLLLAKHLNKLEIKVSLAYGSYSQVGQMHNDFKEVCEQVFPLKTKNKHDPRHYFELNSVLRREKFDLIHVHLWNPGAGRYAFFAGDKNEIPIVSTEHDPFKLHGIKKWIKKMCLKRTKQTILVSRASTSLLHEYYNVSKEKIEYVANGVELDLFIKNKKKAQLPGNNKIVISCIAELHKRKGHKTLFKAYKKLGKRKDQISLMLVGKGPDEKELKKIAQPFKDVYFLGWRKDIPAILKASDILILPSHNEAFGQVIIEAMATGVPVIAINRGGPEEIIENGATGHLVRDNDADEMALKIIELIDKPEKRKNIIRKAKEVAAKKYSVDRMAKETVFIYKKIAL